MVSGETCRGVGVSSCDSAAVLADAVVSGPKASKQYDGTPVAEHAEVLFAISAAMVVDGGSGGGGGGGGGWVGFGFGCVGDGCVGEGEGFGDGDPVGFGSCELEVGEEFFATN